jgi:hypothetical protein
MTATRHREAWKAQGEVNIKASRSRAHQHPIALVAKVQSEISVCASAISNHHLFQSLLLQSPPLSQQIILSHRTCSLLPTIQLFTSKALYNPCPATYTTIRSMLILWLLTPILHTRAAASGNTSPPYPYDEAIDNGTFGYYPTSTFATESDISAPKVNWLQWDERCNDGTYYFLTPKGWGLPRPGPMILDWRGDLVWSQHFANEWGGQAYDFMVQHYQGQDRLTFWTGDDTVRGHGSGKYMIVSAVLS